MEDAVVARSNAERDNAERHRAERSLHESEERLQRAVTATGIGLFEWDLPTDTLVANSHCRRLLGLTSDAELVGSRVFADTALHRRFLSTAPNTPGGDGPYDFEWKLNGADRRVRWLLISARVEKGAGVADLEQPLRVFGTLLDITARKQYEIALQQIHTELEQRVVERTEALSHANASLEHELRERRAAEEQIKQLFRRLMTAQEDERKAMARDSHDQLGQPMTALRLSLEIARREAGDGPVAPAVARCQQLAEELDQNVDFLSGQLRPFVLEHLGLVAALSSLASNWSDRFGTDISFDASDTDGLRLPAELELNLYRLVQEALHNVYRHSGATSVRLTVGREDSLLSIRVEDNGRGFDPSELASAVDGGLGLISMRERAALVGGGLQIESAPGRGTRIRVQVPLSAAEASPS